MAQDQKVYRLGFLGTRENPFPTADEVLPRTGAVTP